MKPKKVVISVDLSKNQLEEKIRELCPKLEDKPFNLYQTERNRKLKQVSSMSPKKLKQTRYQGITIVQEITSVPGVSAQQTDQSVSSQAPTASVSLAVAPSLPGLSTRHPPSGQDIATQSSSTVPSLPAPHPRSSISPTAVYPSTTVDLPRSSLSSSTTSTVSSVSGVRLFPHQQVTPGASQPTSTAQGQMSEDLVEALSHQLPCIKLLHHKFQD